MTSLKQKFQALGEWKSMPENLKKTVLASILCLALIGTVSAQNTFTESLEFKSVPAEFNSQGFNFSVYGDHIQLSPKQVFVPDEISDHASLSGYNYVDGPTGEQVVWTGISFDTGWIHENDAVEDLLAWGSGGGADAGSKYPPTFFQKGAFSSELARDNESVADVFSYDYTLEESGYNVSWEIEVSSHYEHLILEKSLVFSNSTHTETVETWTDTYSGEEPERTAFDVFTNSHVEPGGYSILDQHSLYDNLWENQTEITVAILHPSEGNVSQFDANPTQEKVSIPYSQVKSELEEGNLSDQVILDDTTGYTLETWNVTVAADSKETILSEIRLPDNTEGQSFMYILGSTGGFVTNYSTSGSSFQYGKQLNITSASGTPTVSNKSYPVYFRDGNGSTTGNGAVEIVFSQLQANGEDLRFKDSGESNSLDFQIEHWNSTHGTVWVHIPSAVRDGSDSIHVYWGNSSVSSASDAPGTWSNSGQNAFAVYHLNESSGQTIDSTSNNRDSHSTSGTTYNVAGQFNGARGFDGSSDEVSISESDSTDGFDTLFAGDHTVVTWAEKDDTSSSQAILDYQKTVMSIGYDMQASDGYEVSIYDGNYETVTSSTTSAGSWYHIGYTQNDGTSTLTGYFEGSSMGAASTVGPSTTTNTNNPTRLGYSGDSSAGRWNGSIDEVRIYSDVKNSDWWQADYNASRKAGQTFFSQTAVEEDSGGAVTDNPPSVTLDSPSDGQSFTGTQTISFNASATDDFDLVNATLRTNETGSMADRNTTTFAGSSDTWADAPFSRRLTPGTFKYNYRFYDNNSQSSTASSDFTFTISNQDPVIDSTDVDPDSPVNTDVFDAYMNFTEPDGQATTETLSVWENDSIVNDSVSMNTGTTNDAKLESVLRADEFNTNYIFQFEVSDGTTTSRSNVTKTTASNTPPSIDNKNIIPSNPSLNDLLDGQVNASDSDSASQDLTATVSIWENDTLRNDSVTMSEPSTNDFEIVDAIRADKYNTQYTFQFEVSDGTATVKQNATVTSGSPNSPPTAAFSANTSDVIVDEAISFDASSSSDTDGSISSYEWDWTSDGSYDDTGQTVEHSYSNAGTHTVTLRVTDNEGATDTTTTQIDVSLNNSKNLVESCPATPFCHNSSNPRTLSGRFTEANGSKTYTWTLNATGSGGTYTFFGFFNSTVNRISQSFTDTFDVQIFEADNNQNPSASFTANVNNLDVDVDASGSSDSDGTISSYEWDWTNDGSYDDTGVTATYTYGSDGTYTIKLRVKDNDGATDTTTADVTVSESSGGGGDGGDDGGTGGENDTETTTIGNNSVTLLAPHQEAQYKGEDTYVLEKGESNTITIDGSEHTVELVAVNSTTTALVKQDGTPQTWEQGDTSKVGNAQYHVQAIVEKPGTKNGTLAYSVLNTISFAKYDTWYALNYTVNSSASIELLRRETGYGNSYSVFHTYNEGAAVNNTYRQRIEKLESGVYEVKARLNVSGQSMTTDPVGYYVARVPQINIFDPNDGETILVAGNNGPYGVELNYRVETDTGASLGQYYVDASNGDLYGDGERDKLEVIDGQDDGLITDIRQALNNPWISVLGNYGNLISWLAIPESYVVKSYNTMRVPSTGNYTGYANATANQTGYNWSMTSIGNTVTLQSVEPGGTNYTDYVESRDNDDENNLSKTNVTNRSLGDIDGDNKTDYYYNAWIHIFSPNDGKEYEVTDLGDHTVDLDFDFVVNKSGNFLVNKTVFIENKDTGDTASKELNPARQDYQISFNETKFSGDEWSEGGYKVYGKTYYSNGTAIETVEVDGYEFTVEKAGLVKFAERWFEPVVTGASIVYNFDKDHIRYWIALIIVVGFYLGFRINWDHFVGIVAASMWYIFFAWLGYFPEIVNIAVAGIVAFFLARKLMRGEVDI